MPRPPRLLATLPLVRGLVKLGLALAPLFRRGGAAGPRERLVLLVALCVPVPLLAAPAGARGVVAVALTGGLLVWMLRGRNTGTAANLGRAEPAQGAPQAPLSPTGEAYIEEPSDSE